MESYIIYGYLIIILLFFIGGRHQAWEDYFDKNPKERGKSAEARKKIRQEIIKTIKTLLNGGKIIDG